LALSHTSMTPTQILLSLSLMAQILMVARLLLTKQSLAKSAHVVISTAVTAVKVAVHFVSAAGRLISKQRLFSLGEGVLVWYRLYICGYVRYTKHNYEKISPELFLATRDAGDIFI
jgi:hypothetical protein